MVDYRSLLPPSVAMSEFSLFLHSEAGQRLLARQQADIAALLCRTAGFNCLQLSIGKGLLLAGSERFGRYIRLGYAPASNAEDQDDVWAEYESLPVASQCIDTVVLHHVLDFSPRPHELLREVDRVLNDGGHIVVVSFRPLGYWELYKRLLHFRNYVDRRALQGCKPLSSTRLQDWLGLLNYDLLSQRSSITSRIARQPDDGAMPRLAHTGLRLLSPLGLYYVTLARKKTYAATAVGSRWRVPATARSRELHINGKTTAKYQQTKERSRIKH